RGRLGRCLARRRRTEELAPRRWEVGRSGRAAFVAFPGMCFYTLQNARRQGDGIAAVFPRHEGPLAALHALDEVLQFFRQLVLAANAIPRLQLQMPAEQFVL